MDFEEAMTAYRAKRMGDLVKLLRIQLGTQSSVWNLVAAIQDPQVASITRSQFALHNLFIRY
jgi:hypothetical protein